ncbi:MAG: RsmB/NOP family class I SAM-dependent RNA methyltransferase [Candidatus Heimdallarchaeota archaeon]|nr:RsmB/NOP family class I SAM-dependent RNA methyltransferase [Candidatus Heimdallarchaeota archaeon]
MMKNDDITTSLAREYGYHIEIIERFIRYFGLETTKEILEAYNVPLKKTIRCNTLKYSPQELLKRLGEKGFQLEESPYYDLGFIVLAEPFPLGATTEYLRGGYFIQSQASWLPVLALEVQPGEVIIDFAAAPGGKATHIAQLMENQGVLLCLDISRERMKALRSNLTRCGVKNAITKRMDSTSFWKLNIKADKILLDAPCTGEGLMAIDLDRRKKNLKSDMKRLTEIQKELFASALHSLKKEGVLVYSTCSTAPEENEKVIEWALEQFPIEILELQISKIVPGLQKVVKEEFQPAIRKTGRLFPHLHGTEGFFVCKVQLEEELD